MEFLRGLSLQSRILAVLVPLVLGAVAAVTWTGYTTTRDALRSAAERELLGVQRARTAALRTLLTLTRNQVLRLSGAPETAAVATEFRAAYQQLATEPVTPGMREAVRRFYAEEYAPALGRKLGLATEPDAYLPGTDAGWYLHYHYMASAKEPYTGSGPLMGAGDATAYGGAVRRLAPRIAETARRLNLDNILLIDPETLDVFWSLRSSAILGTNLLDGPYAASNLAALARTLRGSKEEDDYRVADFEFYRPALGAPYAFLASPVFDGPRYVAILAVRLPLEPIAALLGSTPDDRTGRTQETYLLGPDSTMRTNSRFLLEDPAAFLAGLRRSNLATRTVDDVERLRTTVLTVPVRHAAARAALNGESGVMELEDYRGVPVFMAFGPLDLDNLRWGVIAKIDVSEALEPLREYTRRALVTAGGLSILASLLALWLASSLTRPLEALLQGARRVSEGNLDTPVPLARTREFRLLGMAFNDMMASLGTGKAALEAQVQETERLLMSLLPASGAAQVREGRQGEHRAFADVTVAYVSLHGLEGADQAGDATASMTLMSELVAAFDEAAEQFAVEKVRTIGTSYLAASGLSVLRPDHTARMLDFAREMVAIVRRFNAERGLKVTAEISINAGPVTGGLVGRRRFIYDLWGDTVKIARSMGADGRTSIQVTRTVRDRVRDQASFGDPVSLEVPGFGSLEVYPLAGTEA